MRKLLFSLAMLAALGGAIVPHDHCNAGSRGLIWLWFSGFKLT